MASDSRDDLTAQLHIMERGEAAPWIMDRPIAWWYPLGFGVVAAALVLIVGVLDGLAFNLALPVLIVLSWLLHWGNDRRRAPRRAGPMPREFALAIAMYLLGAVAVFAIVIITAQAFGTWPAAAVAFVLGTALIVGTEWLNGRAAVRLRKRLP